MAGETAFGSGSDREYVLGTHDEEVERLGLQHQIWRSQSYALWERAGFRPGHRLLDLGCGPGFTTRDLARLVGRGGSVIAVDVSERFLARLRAWPPEPGAGPIEARVGDVRDLDLGEASIDGAHARWVMSYFPDPERAVAAVARALRPGGALALQEYVAYGSMGVSPPIRLMPRVVSAIEESWRARGGDPDVALSLVPALSSHGLRVERTDPVARIARPGTLLWQWPDTFFRNYLPVLVDRGLLHEDERREFERDWRARSADPDSLFVAPMVLDVVARK